MIATIAQYAGYISSILAMLAILVKPLRERLFNIKAVRDGQLCLLRSEILAIYYKHVDEDEPLLRQYERENLDNLFAAYTAEHGNTFVADIYSTMRHWRVIN